MKIGLILAHAPLARHVEIAQRAEALGYDSIWPGEHIILPMIDNADHPYGKVVIAPRTEFHAPFVQLAAAAAVTTTLRLGTGIILPPIRNVFQTAREIATVDILSGGRLNVGIGIGWHAGESALMGYDFKIRGAYTDEFLDALTCLFSEPEPSYKGKYISFDPVGFEPKPIQSPRPPILVGGDSLPALRRAATRGDGWYGHADSPEQARERITAVRKLVAEAGKNSAAFACLVQVWNPPPNPQAYFDVGADCVVIAPFHPASDPITAIEDYAAKIGLAPK